MFTVGPRREAATALAGLLLAGQVACGGGPAESASRSADTTPASVTRVEHEFGATKVPGIPERIVSLNLQWTDSLLALGVDPVGYAKDSLMPGGAPPWWDADAKSGEPRWRSRRTPVCCCWTSPPRSST